MSRSFASGSLLARSSFFLLIAAGAAACSSSGSGSPSSPDDGGPDSTAESGSDDGSTYDAPGTVSEAGDAGNADAPGTVPDASADSPSNPQDGGSLEASTDAHSSSDAPLDGTSSETGSPPADASLDAPVDSAGEASVDSSVDGPSDAPAEAAPDASGPAIRLFDGHSTGGALGGRAGIDALCASASQADGGPGSANVRGFITVTATDEIKDMPANYGVPTNRPIVSTTGVVIASDWSHLLGGSIDSALTSAGVIVSGNFWYSGSNADGSIATTPVDGGGVHPFTCSGWTDGSAFLDAAYGLAYTTTSTWMASGGQATCGIGGYRVLCLGW